MPSSTATRTTGERGPPCGLAVRMAVAEALHPGELERRLRRAESYLRTLLKRYGGRWAARLGYDSALGEARLGAMKGLVAWLLCDGPANPPGAAKIQTYILHGVRFHFGRAVAWHVGPVRINVREYEKNPRDCLGEYSLPEHLDGTEADESSVFAVEDGGPARVDDADERAFVIAHVLVAANECDPSGGFRRIIEMRHGIPSGRPMTFSEIGRAFGIRRQAAHLRYHRAVDAVRDLLGVRVDAASELG